MRYSETYEERQLLTLRATATGWTQIDCDESVKVCPDMASSNVVPMVSAIACAAFGGTALPIRMGSKEIEQMFKGGA